MLLNKKCNCGQDCKCGENCNCNIQNESNISSKELLGSFDHKIPVLETNKHNYKVIKEIPPKNMLLS